MNNCASLYEIPIMSISIYTSECADCGAEVDGSGDKPEQRTPCNKCGSTKRNHQVSVSETMILRDGIGVKAKRSGEKKPYIEDLGVPDYSRSLNKVVHRARIIDRDNDRYFEKITDYESGEVIHQCEEPLSQHQGHGSAKPKKRPEND
jgi:ribosomal protein S27AE